MSMTWHWHHYDSTTEGSSRILLIEVIYLFTNHVNAMRGNCQHITNRYLYLPTSSYLGIDKNSPKCYFP